MTRSKVAAYRCCQYSMCMGEGGKEFPAAICAGYR